jgi:hypothetical protein
MGLTFIPEKPISLRAARDWSTYEANLSLTPRVRKHLEDTLRSWVTESGIRNPLVLPWVRILADGTLETLETHFGVLESTIGETSLSRLVRDLLRKKGPALDIRRDVAALYGEIIAFEKLKDMGAKSVDKITVDGDWLADGLTVSVKTILDTDHNYTQIEDAIEGYAYLEECPSLRRVGSVRVTDGKGLDNEFMRKILWLIDEDLESILLFVAEGLGFPAWCNCSIEALRIPEIAHADEKGRMVLKVARHGCKLLRISIDDIRAGEPPDGDGHTVCLEMESRDDNSCAFSITNDLNVWWGVPDVDRERLGRQICGRVQEVSTKSVVRSGRDFVGWINIAIHPSLQQGIARQPERFRQFLSQRIGEPSFPIVVLAYGGFELAKRPFVAAFGPPLSFSA